MNRETRLAVDAVCAILKIAAYSVLAFGTMPLLMYLLK